MTPKRKHRIFLHLISVVLDVQGLALGAQISLAQSSLSIGLGTSHESFLSSHIVFLLSSPCLESRRLQGATKGEGQGPGLGNLRDLVHGCQVSGGLLFRLTARQKHDSGDSRGHGTGQSTESEVSSGLDISLGAFSTVQDHVGLQEGTLQKDMVVVESLVAGGKHALGNGSADLNAVRTISQDLGLDNGDQAVGLADDGITGQGVGVLVNGELRRAAVADLEDSTPLGKSSALLVVLGAALAEVVNSLGLSLAVGAREVNNTLVDLDTRDDVLVLEHLDKGGAVGGVLEESLLEQDL